MGLVALVAATTLIAPVGSPVDASGGHLAYSRPDAGAYRLVVDGRDAPVAPAGRPFDVDLGTDAAGRLVAVYAAAGRIRALDVAAGTDRAVPGLRGTAPSVSRGRLLYAVRSGRRDGLRLTTLAGGGRGRAVAVPSARRPECLRGSGRCRTFAVGATELAGGVLAFTSVEGDGVELSSAQLWFARVGRAPRLLARGGGSVNQRTDLLAPQVSSRWVSAGLNHVGDGGYYSRGIRVSPSRGTEQRTALDDVRDARGRGAPAQRDLRGFALGAAGTALTSACAAANVNEPGTPPDCRLVRSAVRWETVEPSAGSPGS